MELNKNAMYAQAGRNRGWSVGVSDDAAPPFMMPANPTAPQAIAAPVMPVMPPMPAMPATPATPPMMQPPVVNLPMFNKKDMDCQTLAMAYVQKQKWQELYETEQGFHRGTIFKELDLPFVGEGACKHE